MPKCKVCGTRLTKFDKDICPVCGTKSPFGDEINETIDITSEIDINNPEFKDAFPRHRKTAFLLFVLLGWTGYPFFYLRKKKLFPIWGLINIALIAGLSVAFYFITKIVFVGILIAFGAVILANTFVGLYFLLFPDVKDGSGEFLN